MPNKFFNPYAFVPALPREGVTGELGDRAPTGHDRFHEERIGGRIDVTLTTVTPLLIPDAARRTEVPDAPSHFLYPLRVDGKGAPYLPATSVKGMLRAAYEAVTNSRLSVFKGHEARLGLRMDSKSGLDMVPARVDGGHLELMLGTNPNSVLFAGQRPRTMFAAWLPHYTAGQAHDHTSRRVAYSNGERPCHGEKVRCHLRLHRHERQINGGLRTFHYWRVVSIAPADGRLPLTEAPPGQDRGPRHWALNDVQTCEGWVYITNQNFSQKHDERVFFSIDAPVRVPIDPAWLTAWSDLIADYRAIHEKEVKDRFTGILGTANERNDHPAARFQGRDPGRTAWSAHVYDDAWKTLKDGSLCYARVDRSGTVVGLYPVMISRGLHEAAPLDLLEPSLRPASSPLGLSPADRVFGWVNEEGAGAHRGQLRIGPVTCETPNPVEDFVSGTNPNGLPLAVLGAPKPEQARFYVAADAQGAPLSKSASKAQGYGAGGGLRGRKVYPHHGNLPLDHWTVSSKPEFMPATSRGPAGDRRHQAFLRPASQSRETLPLRDNQNRSIAAWVKEGVTFSFTIHATNLSRVELGALLWLLDLDRWEPGNAHFHRLGGGKPLGFGSVRVAVTACELAGQESLKARYRSLRSPPPVADIETATLVGEFRVACVDAYAKGQAFQTVPFIKAFLAAARGRSAFPTHYPTVQVTGDQRIPAAPVAESYKWFTENETRHYHRLPLPELSDDRDGALPVHVITRF
ncbi:MAG: TIGR03986 family CRISPR-associated RAMP protein [Alphaproteobacteria bacterium]